MLSQYKTHVGLEVEVCFGSSQDTNSFIMIVLTGTNRAVAPSCTNRVKVREEKNEQVNTNKHHILSILRVHQCTESGVHQLAVVNPR